MRKNLIIFASVLILGIVTGVWLCSELHPAHRSAEPQRDTIVRYVKYTPLELKAKTIKLDVPRLGTMAMVFIPYDSTKVVYRDNIQYLPAPREYYFTKTDEAEIYHSGIDSRIDSLKIVSLITNITNVTHVQKEKKHSIELGIEASYARAFEMPVQLEYSYAIKPWLSVYGYAQYELFTKQFGAGAGTKVRIGW